MRLALRELHRRPGRFLVATAILGVIAVLLMFLGGLLDGLLASSTGAYRAQRADVIVYSANARESLVRSRVESTDRGPSNSCAESRRSVGSAACNSGHAPRATRRAGI